MLTQQRQDRIGRKILEGLDRQLNADYNVLCRQFSSKALTNLVRDEAHTPPLLTLKKLYFMAVENALRVSAIGAYQEVARTSPPPIARHFSRVIQILANDYVDRSAGFLLSSGYKPKDLAAKMPYLLRSEVYERIARERCHLNIAEIIGSSLNENTP